MTPPTVIGPVTAGTRGGPWSAPQADLDTRGYVMEEFFLDGIATSYRLQPGAELAPDGRWSAERDDTAAYRTRVLVVRPSSRRAFNGAVVVQWLNVTAGYELGTADDDELLSGYAWVGVSAQRVGIHGFPDGTEYRGRQAPNPPLKKWDATRYDSLDHPGDRYSFDIFTQAACAVRERDVIGGFDVAHLIATGASQSGARLTTYLNAVQPLESAFDAFMPTITSGYGTPLVDGADRAASRFRDDLEAPIMVVNTECEAVAMHPNRRPDGDRFRFWEVAGAPHAVAIAPAATPRPGGLLDNPLTYRPIVSAAYRHMRRWLTDGKPPPAQPRIEFSDDAAPTIARDRFGNALGGIRLPELEVPTAEYRGRDDTGEGLTVLYGWKRPFTADELSALYASAEVYAKAYADAVDNLVASGALRPEDAPAMKAAATFPH